jgi:hypothetical protein
VKRAAGWVGEIEDLFLDAARHHGLKQSAKQIALAKPAVAVLGERRRIRHVAFEPKTCE